MTDDQWTVERLVEYAKTLDETRRFQSPDEHISNRQLAFGARKLARAKQ